MTSLWIALGSALGGVGRYWCAALVSRQLGEAFPWGTLLVNVAGSFLIGVASSWSASLDHPWAPGPEARAFIMVGFCGGYTTFSAFSLQTLQLLREGQLWYALGNVVLSAALCLIAVWLGYLAGGGLHELRTGQQT